MGNDGVPMKRWEPGQLGPRGENFDRHVREVRDLPSDLARSLYHERRMARYTLPWGVPLALAGIPVGAAHGTRTPIAVSVGVLISVGLIVTRQTWPRPWSWWASAGLVLATAWPAAEVPQWWFFWGLEFLFFALIGAIELSERRRSRRLDRSFGIVTDDRGNPVHGPAR